MAINVCVSTTNGLFSRLIRWFTRSKVSHSLLTFRDAYLDEVFVMEANGRGFMLVPWKKWRTKNTLVARYELSVESDKQLGSIQRLAEYLGSQYDYVSLFGFVLRRFMKRMGNPLDNATKLVCSEAVAKFLYGAGLDRFKEAQTFTPEDIYEIAQEDDVFVQQE